MEASLKMQFVILLLCNMCVAIISASCDGEHQYVDIEGNCQLCMQCGPGSQPSSHHCGWGSKEPSYRCVPCEEGTYSTGYDYQYCKSCAPCWNSAVTVQCTATSNAQCGDCNVGYFRPILSNGKQDEECHKCLENTKDPQCKIEPEIWIYIVAVVCGVLVVLVSSLVSCYCCLRRMKTGSSKKQTDRSKLAYILNCPNNDDTVNSTSLQPLTAEDRVEQEDNGSRDLQEPRILQGIFYQPPNVAILNEEMSSYADRITATFPPDPQLPSNYSQQPTAAFDDTHRQDPVARGPLQTPIFPDTARSSRTDIRVESFDLSVKTGDFNEYGLNQNPREQNVTVEVECVR